MVKQLGVVATREQHFKQDYDTPTFIQLHPLGETCFVVLQKSYRFSAVSDTDEKFLSDERHFQSIFSHVRQRPAGAHCAAFW